MSHADLTMPDSAHQVRKPWLAVVAVFSTFAFPVVWYGASLLTIWRDFARAIATTPNGEQIYVWRQHGAAVGDFMLFAIALWAAHVTTILARRLDWRSIPVGFGGAASGLAGALTFAVVSLLGAVFPAVGRGFTLIALVAISATVATTLVMPTALRRMLTAPDK